MFCQTWVRKARPLAAPRSYSRRFLPRLELPRGLRARNDSSATNSSGSLAEDQRIEAARARRVSADDEFLPLIDPHLPPRAGTLTRLVKTVATFGDDAFKIMCADGFKNVVKIPCSAAECRIGSRSFGSTFVCSKSRRTSNGSPVRSFPASTSTSKDVIEKTGADPEPWFCSVLNAGRPDASRARSSPSITVSSGRAKSAFAISGNRPVKSLSSRERRETFPPCLNGDHAVAVEFQLVDPVRPFRQ
jgi:hypothetical protein